MRAKSIKALYEQQFKTFAFDGIYKEVFGEPEKHGAWLIWGGEKNGKTWLALKLADYLSKYESALYISAEEGCNKDFIETCQRAGVDAKNKKLKIIEYISLMELEERLQKRRAPKVVFIDNITVFNEELMYGKFRGLLKRFRNTLFVFLAHSENNQPYTSTAKLCKKLAKVIIHVEGLTAMVSGRCPGGSVMIDETKSQLYWGTDTQNKN